MLKQFRTFLDRKFFPQFLVVDLGKGKRNIRISVFKFFGRKARYKNFFVNENTKLL